MDKVPPKTLTRELLLEFLGGILVIRNPSCCQRGVADCVSLDEDRDGKVGSIGVLFTSIIQQDQFGRPMPGTEATDYGMSFELKPDKIIVHDDDLIVPTKFREETLTFTRARLVA